MTKLEYELGATETLSYVDGEFEGPVNGSYVEPEEGPMLKLDLLQGRFFEGDKDASFQGDDVGPADLGAAETLGDLHYVTYMMARTPEE